MRSTRLLIAASLISVAAPAARADEEEAPMCTTTTTTTTRCTGSAAPLAAPQAEAPPQVAPPPQVIYAPPQVIYQPPPPPYMPTYHYELRPRYGLISAGVAVSAVWYLGSALAASAGANAALAVPIVGPLIAAGMADKGLVGIAMLDFVIQAGGFAMIIAGSVLRKEKRVLDRFAVVPTASGSGGGLAAVGRF